jgi:hypothetical protein
MDHSSINSPTSSRQSSLWTTILQRFLNERPPLLGFCAHGGPAGHDYHDNVDLTSRCCFCSALFKGLLGGNHKQTLQVITVVSTSTESPIYLRHPMTACVQVPIFTLTCYILWYEGISKSFRTESITKTIIIKTRWEATQRVMAAKLTRLTHKIAIQLHLVAESCTICSSHARWPVRKLLDTLSYTKRWMYFNSFAENNFPNSLNEHSSFRFA